MNRKFYVSLEAAKLLKEKGYNEVCEQCFYYNDYHDKWDFDSPYNLFDDDPMFYTNKTIDDEMYSMPTKAEAIDWLESKGMTIEIHWIRFNENRRWNYSIFNCSTCDTIDTKYICTTRLEAEDAAIIKALELL